MSPDNNDLRDLDRRVTDLETQAAVRKERDVHIDKRFDRLETMQKDTQGTLTKLAWLIISTVIVAGLTFFLSGGAVDVVG